MLATPAAPAPVTLAEVTALLGPKKIRLRSPKMPLYRRLDDLGRGVLGLDTDFTDRWCAAMEDLIGGREPEDVLEPEWVRLGAEAEARAA